MHDSSVFSQPPRSAAWASCQLFLSAVMVFLYIFFTDGG